jgi:hypothetical protein
MASSLPAVHVEPSFPWQAEPGSNVIYKGVQTIVLHRGQINLVPRERKFILQPPENVTDLDWQYIFRGGTIQ